MDTHGILRKFVSTSLIAVILSTFSMSIQAKPSEPWLFPEPLPHNMQAFIDQMASKYHFNKRKLTQLLLQAQYIPQVLQSADHPMEKQTWDSYRKYFLSENRIRQGVNYWKTHQQTLQDIQKKYGVDPSIIVAIIGIETLYGKNSGRFQELGALSTLAFAYPQRSSFFQKELKEFLILSRDYHLPPLELKGSYAGALGIPQFMPSSYRYYAVNYSNNNKVDLLHDHSDAIASVANYLKKSGWQENAPIAVPAKAKHEIPAQLISKNAKNHQPLHQWLSYGIKINKPINHQTPAALIALQNTHNKEYWLVFHNFRAILSYNTNITYAMAVYQLSQAIREAYEKNTV